MNIDRDGLAWADPTCEDVQKYYISIVEDAAGLGFDEIQFDYVRFPDATDSSSAKQSLAASRIDTIVGFLNAAKSRLAQPQVAIAADHFLWNLCVAQRTEDDLMRIGQPMRNSGDVVVGRKTLGLPSMGAGLERRRSATRSARRASERTAGCFGTRAIFTVRKIWVRCMPPNECFHPD